MLYYYLFSIIRCHSLSLSMIHYRYGSYPQFFIGGCFNYPQYLIAICDLWGVLTIMKYRGLITLMNILKTFILYK